LKICGIASGFAFGYDPTGRFVFSIKIDRSTPSLDPKVLERLLSTGRIPYIFNLAFDTFRLDNLCAA
jgi:hypothetical protein